MDWFYSQKPNHSNKRCSDVEKLPASEPILLQVCWGWGEATHWHVFSVFITVAEWLRCCQLTLALNVSQHYPLYRSSDAECSGEDSAPPEEKNVPFKEKYDVLSQEASQKVWFLNDLTIGGWVGDTSRKIRWKNGGNVSWDKQSTAAPALMRPLRGCSLELLPWGSSLSWPQFCRDSQVLAASPRALCCGAANSRLACCASCTV